MVDNDGEMTNEEVFELIAKVEEKATRGEIPKIRPLWTLDGRPKYQVLDEDDGYHD